MRQFWLPLSQNGFWHLVTQGKYPGFLFLKPNPLVDTLIAQVSLIKYFFLEFFAYISLKMHKPPCRGA
jgi:hypothetical protein